MFGVFILWESEWKEIGRYKSRDDAWWAVAVWRSAMECMRDTFFAVREVQ